MRTRSLILAAAFFALSAQAEPAPREQLNTTLKDLARSKETEIELKKRLAAAEREMETMRTRATNLAEALQASEARVTHQEEALAKANAAYAQKRHEFEERKAEYATTVLSMLRMRTLPATSFASSREDNAQLLRTASVLQKTNTAIAAKAARLCAEDRAHRLRRDL